VDQPARDTGYSRATVVSAPVISDAENMWIDGWNAYFNGVPWGGSHPVGFFLGWLDAARITVLTEGIGFGPHKPS
jgi:hypothetical protein